jgi:hypothetical protein
MRAGIATVLIASSTASAGCFVPVRLVDALTHASTVNLLDEAS